MLLAEQYRMMTHALYSCLKVVYRMTSIGLAPNIHYSSDNEHL